MEEHVLGPRGKVLEDEFFRKEEAKILERMRAQKQRQLTHAELRNATGITDVAVLDRLIGLGLSQQTLVALTLVPMVEVAWADGSIASEERKLVLQVARDSGLDGHSQDLLASWLGHAPDRALADAWRSYVVSLALTMTPQERSTWRDDVLDRARKVATAAGGVLGIGKVSKAEEAKLKDLGTAFE